MSNRYQFSAWDVDHVCKSAEMWVKPAWVVPGTTDTTRWYNELHVKLGERLARQENDHKVETACRYMAYFREMRKGIWPHLTAVQECFVLDMVSQALKKE
jgi:hypothetical protein